MKQVLPKRPHQSRRCEYPFDLNVKKDNQYFEESSPTITLLRTRSILCYIRARCVPRSKHSTSVIKTYLLIMYKAKVTTVERRLSERQSSETSNIRTHIFFVKIFSAVLFFFKYTVHRERVTKPAETARQTAKSRTK